MTDKPKPAKKPRRRVTISVRQVDADLWERMRDEANAMGLNVRAVVDEMLADWLKKHNR